MKIKRIPKEKMGKLHKALIKMGTDGLEEPYINNWTPQRPTTGRCHIVTQVIYRCCAPKGYYACCMTVNNRTHWYLRDRQGNVIDATRGQFDEPPTDKQYMEGRPVPVCRRKGAEMTPYAKELATNLGLREKPRTKKKDKVS